MPIVKILNCYLCKSLIYWVYYILWTVADINLKTNYWNRFPVKLRGTKVLLHGKLLTLYFYWYYHVCYNPVTVMEGYLEQITPSRKSLEITVSVVIFITLYEQTYQLAYSNYRKVDNILVIYVFLCNLFDIFNYILIIIIYFFVIRLFCLYKKDWQRLITQDYLHIRKFCVYISYICP